MNFLKKYSTLLIPVGITLAALVIFVFVFISQRALGKEITEQSVNPHTQIKSMLSKVPSELQAQEEAAYQSQHSKDAADIARLAKESTQRELISYKIFPKPIGTSSQVFIEYGNDYRSSIEAFLNKTGARDAPTDVEIENETGGARRRGTLSRASSRGGDKQEALIDAICRRRAHEIKVYANPSLFQWYDFWEDYDYIGTDEALKDCWDSQVAYWIYEDVIETIGKMNSGSSSVLTSPVKRLLGVRFQEPVGYNSSRRRGGGTQTFVADTPDYILFGGVGPLKVNAWTKRISNEEIDVVHFSVAVVLDSRATMSFIKELCSSKEHVYREGYKEDGEEKVLKHNQITILESAIESFDRKDELHDYYYYGDCAVIRLNLICEYVLNREGYDSLKPEIVKEFLGQAMEEAEASSSKSRTGRSKK
jgi:hypothetical protein